MMMLSSAESVKGIFTEAVHTHSHTENVALQGMDKSGRN